MSTPNLPPPLPTADGGLSLLPPEFQQRVRGELQVGERLVWTARPVIDAVYGGSGGGGCAMMIGAGLLLGGLLLMLLALGLWGGPGGFGKGGAVAISLLLGAGGVLVLISPAWVRRRQRETVYVLTDRRAVISSPSRYVRGSYGPQELAAMVTRENPNGSGDLVFAEVTVTAQDATKTTALGFLGLLRVREIEALVRHTLLPPR